MKDAEKRDRQEKTGEKGAREERLRRRVVRELTSIAFANAADYGAIIELPEGGSAIQLKATHQLTAGQKTALAAVKESKGGVELKLKDSLKALELLCKLSGFLGGEKKESSTGQLDELIEGLRDCTPDPDPEQEED